MVMQIISLGAGVQSSTMALMAARREIGPMPDAAIFADTQAEPSSVMDWLDWLETKLPFPVYRVTAGSLENDELRIRRSGKTGKLYLDGSIPAFVLKPDGKKGLLGRKCTADYKIIPLQRKVKELTGIKRAGRGVVGAQMWIGISTDEAHRMKPSRVDYIENTYPLIDVGFSRADCLTWMLKNGYPTPPRSACRFCPFHSDSEWMRIKEEEPDEFLKVIKFERELQGAALKQEVLKGIPYLHDSCKPIDEIDFSLLIGDSHKQMDMFGNECEGMCGV